MPVHPGADQRDLSCLPQWRFHAPLARAFARLGAALAALATGLVLSLLPAAAQAQQFNFERFGPSDGLTNHVVRCAVQDGTGFIWLCTENGLFRFDGRRFERFAAMQGITDSDIRSAAIGPDGRIWVGTPTNLFHADGDRFVAVRPGGRALRMTRPGQQIQVLSSDEVLVTELQKVLRLHRQGAGSDWTVAPFLTPAQLAAEPGLGKTQMIYAQPGGSVWLGCDQALCELRGGQLKRWGPAEGVATTPWRTMMRDRAGRLWARGVDRLTVLAPGASTFMPNEPPGVQVLNAFNYLPMVEDLEGHVLLRVASGVARWDGERWTVYGVRNGLLPTVITGLMTDRDGEVWVATAGRGFSRWQGYGQWENWTAAQGLEHENVWSMVRAVDGALWMAASDGCRRLAPDSTQVEPCKVRGLPAREINAIEQGADGAIYVIVATTELYRIDPRTREAVLLGKLPRTLRLLPTTEGVWAVGDLGPLLMTPTDPAHPATAPWQQRDPSGYGKPTSAALLMSDGRLVFPTEEGVLLRRLDGQWSLLPINHASGPTEIVDIAEAPDGLLWVGTVKGMVKALLASDRFEHIEWLETPLLRDMNVAYLRFDTRGWLWVGTEQGVVFFDGTAWRRVDQSDGLIWNDSNFSAFRAERDGSIWFGTSGGVSHLKAPELMRKQGALQLVVTRARYGQQALVTEPAASPAKGLRSGAIDGSAIGSRVDWRNDAALEVGVSLLRPALSRGTTLRYRIPSLSPTWFETPSTEFRAPALSPGVYQLEISARHDNAGLAAPITRLSFEVVAPWWRTVWFELSVAGFVLLAVALAWRQRTKLLRARQQQLERLLERATRDPLTGLWNRATILDLLGTEIDKARRSGAPLAVAVIDIDHFKNVNDTHGHLGGDEVLRTLGRVLANGARQSDLLGRYGGEELLLVMPGLPHSRPSAPVERLRQLVGESDSHYEGKTIHVTASMGVHWWGPDIPDVQALIAGADEALYAAKHAGRDRVVYAGPDKAAVTATESVPA